jgi:orotidine-5'-phosphate decarboxylase
MSFREQLAHAVDKNRSLLCVGLDPDPARIPTDKLASYLCSVVDATSDLVCAYKPNLAFYEQFGEAGYAALRTVIEHIPDQIPVIADAKRGDIGHTAEAYARAIFDELGFDASTVNPYGGQDSVEPFTRYADKGVIIWCRSSNPGARDIQDLPVGPDGTPLYQVVAGLANEWNVNHNIGLVCGATYPEELAILRRLCPSMPILVPGVGSQEGELAASVRAGLNADGAGIIVNASRAVLYASDGADFADAARRKAEELRGEIERHRSAARQESLA